MRKHQLISGNIYHVFNRGVEKRVIFADNKDFVRFIKGLSVFNDIKPLVDFNGRFQDVLDNMHERERLVDVLAFCLMPNHFHLLLKQKTENGITEFMRKVGVGYANYFNIRHKRVGALFQGKFKSVWVQDNAQFLYIPHYIHLNPLDLTMPNWRERGISSKKQALDFLGKYEWSSFQDYIGSNNFNIVLNKDLLNEFFNRDYYKEEFMSFVRDLDPEAIADITLE